MDPFARSLHAFLDSFYRCLDRRADALFELTDAILTTGSVSSPPHLSLAAVHRRRLGVSERRACRVIAQPRSSQPYVGHKAERDRRLAERMIELSWENPRYGYRRVWALLRREGWPVNKKRVHRLWRQEGLKVPQKQCKRRRLQILGESENGCTR